jgi:hypothetical protein
MKEKTCSSCFGCVRGQKSCYKKIRLQKTDGRNKKINHNNFIMEKEKCQVGKNYVKTFKLNLLLAELESCFGRISTPMSVMLDRVTERELDFYIDKIVKKGGDANVR